MNISETIKEARERLGLTQEDLAERLEVRPSRSRASLIISEMFIETSSL